MKQTDSKQITYSYGVVLCIKQSCTSVFCANSMSNLDQIKASKLAALSKFYSALKPQWYTQAPKMPNWLQLWTIREIFIETLFQFVKSQKIKKYVYCSHNQCKTNVMIVSILRMTQLTSKICLKIEFFSAWNFVRNLGQRQRYVWNRGKLCLFHMTLENGENPTDVEKQLPILVLSSIFAEVFPHSLCRHSIEMQRCAFQPVKVYVLLVSSTLHYLCCLSKQRAEHVLFEFLVICAFWTMILLWKHSGLRFSNITSEVYQWWNCLARRPGCVISQ